MAYALLSPSLGQPDPCDEAVPAFGKSHLRKLTTAAAALVVPEPPVQPEKVISLFSDQNDFLDDPDAPLPGWLYAVQLVRDVGAKLRSERDRVRAIIQQSRSLTQATTSRVKEADLRAEVAATSAAIAVLRADRAEVRARLAEERAQQAEDQARAAQADEKDAQMLLRRLHADLTSKRNGLMMAPGQAVRF